MQELNQDNLFSLNDTVQQPMDSLQVNPPTASESDKVSNSLKDIIAIATIKDPTKNSTKLDPDNIKTEQEAETFFLYEVVRRYRFFQYENALENLTKDEVIDAIYDTLEEINQTTPPTDYSLLNFVALGHRYRRLLILGAAKYSVLTLISIWTSNGIDVQVEDLSVSSKLSDFQQLFQTFDEQFKERLAYLKNYDRLVVRQTTFSTGLRKFSNRQTLSTRVSRYTSGGYRLG